MTSKLFTVCLLLPVVFARIEIDITASTNEKERDVELFGSNKDIISDEERITFQLNDESLKDAVLTHFGRRPDSVYLRSPTPWGDLYQSYNWGQVIRTLAPQRASILSVNYEPMLISTQIFNNNNSKAEEIQVRIAQELENTLSSAWEKNEGLKVGQEINYGLKVKDLAVSEFMYRSRWGENTSKSKKMVVGSKSEATITLEPNQSVIAELYATKATMKIKVDYEAKLSGAIAVNYADTFKGHQFWSLDVEAVMSSAGLKNSVLSSEVMELNYFTDSRVVVKDLSSNVMLYSVPLDFY